MQPADHTPPPQPSAARGLERAEWTALGAAVLIVLLQAGGALPAALEYRADAWWREPWRLVGAHVVHVNWRHAIVNAAAWWLVARLFGAELPARRQALAALVALAAVDAGLVLLYPAIAWYRGASGVLHGLFFAGATAWLLGALRTRRAPWWPALLLAGATVKLVIEQPATSLTPYAGWLEAPTVPQAHWLGAVGGTLAGLAFAWRDRQRAGAHGPERNEADARAP